MNTFIRFINFFNLKRQWTLQKTNYGRSEGWEVYVGETKIAEFLEPAYIEQFWVSYKLAHVEPSYDEKVKTLDFWYEQPIRYKSKVMGEFATCDSIMISVNADIVNNRIAARRLYIE